MRLALLLLMVSAAAAQLPTPAAAQTALRLDVGLAYTSGDETYAEVSGAATTPLVGPIVLSVGAARAGALFDVSYGVPGGGEDIDPEHYAVPSTVQSWTTVSLLGGVRLDGAAASFQATVGPVLSVAEKTFGDVLVGGGVGAEVGVLDVYPVPSVGVGFSVHGATTTSHTWAGGRLGVRVRL